MTHHMVRLAVALRGSARHAQELVETFRFLIVSTRLEPGCLGCSAWADPDATVHYVEEWTTEPEMRRRVRSAGFTSLLAVLESAREPPCIEFQFVSTTRGLDYVEEARSDSGNQQHQ
jgi:quinol monooxygenase YgiN